MTDLNPNGSAPKTGRNLRKGGRIVDVRLRLTAPPDRDVLKVIESKLRENDAVFSFEGFEIELALSGTSSDDVSTYVLPRLLDALRQLNLGCPVIVSGAPLDETES